MPIDQIASLVGAALILAAFIANTLEKLSARSLVYLLLNLIGGGLMTFTAVVGRQWGFIALESTWTFMAAVGLLRRAWPRATTRPE